MTNAIKNAADLNNVIVVDFSAVAEPQGDYAKKLAAEAADRLNQKGGIKAIEEGRSDIYKVNPYTITVEPGFNSRNFADPANQKHVDDLARSIKENGVKEPLTVYFDDKSKKLVLTDGECRLRGTLRAIEVYGAEIKTIPVKKEDKYASAADRVLGQIIRNSGKGFSPLEKADNFKKLLALGWNEAQIAQKAALSTTRVVDLLSLNTLGEPIRALITTGKVTTDFVLDRMKANGNDQEKALADLTGAIENAEAKGKKKASAKHLGDGAARRPSSEAARKEVASLMRKARIIESDDTATITVSADDFARIKELLGL